MSPCKVNMKASRIIFQNFFMVFSLLIFSVFLTVFDKSVFFKSDQVDRVRPWMVVRVIRTYALFELSSDMVPFLMRVMEMTHLWDTSNVTIPWDLILRYIFVFSSPQKIIIIIHSIHLCVFQCKFMSFVSKITIFSCLEIVMT